MRSLVIWQNPSLAPQVRGPQIEFLFKNGMAHILILLQDPEPTGLKIDIALLSKRCKTITLTLLAVVVVLVQGKAVETSTLVAAHRVLTDVLTSSVVDGTLVLI